MFANNKQVVKYTGFHIAKENNQKLFEKVGTPKYAAPELYNVNEQKEYTKEVDVW